MTDIADELSFAYEDLAHYLVPKGSGNSPVSGTKPKGMSLRDDVLSLRSDISRWLGRYGLAQRFGGGIGAQFRAEGQRLLDRYEQTVDRPDPLDDVFIDCPVCYGRMTWTGEAAECTECDVREMLYEIVRRKRLRPDPDRGTLEVQPEEDA